MLLLLLCCRRSERGSPRGKWRSDSDNSEHREGHSRGSHAHEERRSKREYAKKEGDEGPPSKQAKHDNAEGKEKSDIR